MTMARTFPVRAIVVSCQGRSARAAVALPAPDLSSFNILAAVFTVAATILMMTLKRGFVTTMAVLGVAGVGVSMVFGMA